MISLVGEIRRRARIDFYGDLFNSAPLDAGAYVDSSLAELIRDEAIIANLNSTEFFASANLQRYAESYLYSWRELFERASQQRSALSCLEGHPPFAWRLVTCYYLAFFASGLIRYAGGRVALFVDDDLAAELTRRSPGGSPRLEKGMYFGQAKVSKLGDSVELVFRARGDRPHQIAWSELHELVRSAARSDPEPTGDRFCSWLASTSHESPAEVRNRWNYADATLYGQHGERVCKRFDSLMSGNSSIRGWLMRPGNSEDLAAEFIAVLACVLWRTIELLNEDHERAVGAARLQG